MFVQPDVWHMRNVENAANFENMISVSGNRPRRPIIWDDVRAFLAVARHGTLTAAAGALGIGIATLSRRVDRLENSLGVPLFVRQQSGYQLTEEGSELPDRGEALEQAALAFESAGGREAQLTGRVRLATAENLASGLILPRLPEFRRLHPRLMVELVTDIVTVNVHRRDADLALRMVKPERGNVTIRRLGTLGYGLYAAPSYVATRSVDTHQGAYEGDEIITWGDAQSHLPSPAPATRPHRRWRCGWGRSGPAPRTRCRPRRWTPRSCSRRWARWCRWRCGRCARGAGWSAAAST